MKFEPALIKTTLVKRYKRFLADVVDDKQSEFTAHCPNTGSMKNCWQPGWAAWLLDSQNSKRKYLYTWVLTQNDANDYIGINTHYANSLVYEAIVEQKIPELSDYQAIQREVKYGDENSRIDILLTDKANTKTYIEIKSVTLLEQNGEGYFPDSVSTRGQKHLRELISCAQQGHRAILFFLVQHSGIQSVSAAAHIDPTYAQLLDQAITAGVEVLAYKCKISPAEISVDHSVPFVKSN
jgi:sugar fermentation stimulation protein A